MRERIASHRLRALVLAVAIAGVACVPAYERRLAQHRSTGNLDAAAELVATAAERDPGNPAIRRESGVVAFERGDNEVAAAELTEALALAPGDLRAEIYLAAAMEKSGRWAEAVAHYRRAEVLSGDSPLLKASLSCQRIVVESRRAGDRAEARLAAEQAGTLNPGDRLLILPCSVYGENQRAASLALGLAAILSEDWKQAPAPAPVSFAELTAFLARLDVPVGAAIEPALRERLASLTGARYVLAGQLTELHGMISLAPLLIDRGPSAPESPTTEPKEVRFEYQQARIGALVELEQALLFRLAQALDVEFAPAAWETGRRFSRRSGEGIALYAEALYLEQSGEEGAAAEKLAEAMALDPDFELARDAALRLSSCRGEAGDPDAVVESYELSLRRARERDRARALLAGTTEDAGRIGGRAGEGDDLSINRSAASGTAVLPIRWPR